MAFSTLDISPEFWGWVRDGKYTNKAKFCEVWGEFDIKIIFLILSCQGSLKFVPPNNAESLENSLVSKERLTLKDEANV